MRCVLKLKLKLKPESHYSSAVCCNVTKYMEPIIIRLIRNDRLISLCYIYWGVTSHRVYCAQKLALRPQSRSHRTSILSLSFLIAVEFIVKEFLRGSTTLHTYYCR